MKWLVNIELPTFSVHLKGGIAAKPPHTQLGHITINCFAGTLFAILYSKSCGLHMSAKQYSQVGNNTSFHHSTIQFSLSFQMLIKLNQEV